MLNVALTGGIGSGKSSVADLFAQLGAVIVDADQISRNLVEPGQPALDDIVERFGNRVLQDDGRLDRAALAQIVFSDKDALASLNSILHPRVAQESAALVDEAPADAVVIYDVPLLVESAGTAGWDAIVVVETDRAIRLTRLEQSRNMVRDEAEARMSVQATDQERRAVADYVIANNGSPADLFDLVAAVWASLTEG